MTSLLGKSPSWICGRWKLHILPAPVRRFLPVAVELLPEQVIAMTVIRNCHIEGTPRVSPHLLRHLHIVLAQVRVPGRQPGIGRGFCDLPALCLLGRAPLDAAHTCTCVPVQVCRAPGRPTLPRCGRDGTRSVPSCPGSSGTSDAARSWVLYAVFLPYKSPYFFLQLDQILCSSCAGAVLILCCRSGNGSGFHYASFMVRSIYRVKLATLFHPEHSRAALSHLRRSVASEADRQAYNRLTAGVPGRMPATTPARRCTKRRFIP